MRVKVITVATYASPGLEMLKKSMDHFGIDYAVLGQGERWRGFGMKILKTVEYLRGITDSYTHFIFVDAYDVYFLHSLRYVEHNYNYHYADRLVFSTEKACWPHPEKAELYPESKSIWKYLNSGGYMGPIKGYLDLIDNNPVQDMQDDQAYFTDLYLKGNNGSGPITLDYDCRIFQSIAFEYEGDFLYNLSLVNNRTGTMPAIIHGNGRTPMEKIYKLRPYANSSRV